MQGICVGRDKDGVETGLCNIYLALFIFYGVIRQENEKPARKERSETED